ncbi:hypothetical protein [Alkalibacillus silvisoli]|uniref:Uncharacterized protein n=1 Tax=Alkalibacillus silvisoli TaxID=392823 RepID=A0ABP3K367_9BACI
MRKFDYIFKRFCESLARKVRKNDFIQLLSEGSFHSVLKWAGQPIKALAYASDSWCQTELYYGDCLPPNGQYCNSDCESGLHSFLTRCPAGMQVSYAWGYMGTGCWCDSGGSSRLACCDCTLDQPDFNPYERNAGDCGCLHRFVS